MNCVLGEDDGAGKGKGPVVCDCWGPGQPAGAVLQLALKDACAPPWGWHGGPTLEPGLGFVRTVALALCVPVGAAPRLTNRPHPAHRSLMWPEKPALQQPGCGPTQCRDHRCVRGSSPGALPSSGLDSCFQPQTPSPFGWGLRLP